MLDRDRTRESRPVRVAPARPECVKIDQYGRRRQIDREAAAERDARCVGFVEVGYEFVRIRAGVRGARETRADERIASGRGKFRGLQMERVDGGHRCDGIVRGGSPRAPPRYDRSQASASSAKACRWLTTSACAHVDGGRARRRRRGAGRRRVVRPHGTRTGECDDEREGQGGTTRRDEHGRCFATGGRESSASPSRRRERVRLSVPTQVVHVVEHVDLRPQRREIAKQQRVLALPVERRGESRGSGDSHAPRMGAEGDRFQVTVRREHGGGRLRAPIPADPDSRPPASPTRAK